MVLLCYIPLAMLLINFVFMILHHAIDIGNSHNHQYIHAKLLDTFPYLLGEHQADEHRERG